MEDPNLRYFIGKPNKTRKTYALVCYRLIDRKTKKYQSPNPTTKKLLDKINQNLLLGVIKPHEAEILLKELIAGMYRKAKVLNMVLKHSVISEINQKIFNQYWATEYSNRYLSDENSPRFDILKAIKLIEPLSLATASAADFQKALKKNSTKVAEMRRAVDRLNQLLRFLGRDFKLHKPPEPVRTIQHVKKQEFDRIVSFIEDTNMQNLAVTLFSSGLRLSEALALTEDDHIDTWLNVNKQLTKGGEIKKPKRGKEGKSLILPFGKDAVEQWIACENKDQYRFKLFDALEIACKKAYPTNKAKWIGPHDLRHSHAIYLLSKGASLTQVALNLRNRVDVCQKYYTGFAHTDDTIEALKKIV